LTWTLTRTLALGGLLLVLTFALAACSGSSTATTGPSTGPTTGPTIAPASVAPATTAPVSEAPPASAAAAGGCTAGTVPATVALSIKDFAFSPRAITVKVGDVLGWQNDDSAAHTATLDDGSCDTGAIGSGSAGDRTFAFGADAAGKTFSYHCAIHPRMTATIVVSP
jgi:plastocyanin